MTKKQESILKYIKDMLSEKYKDGLQDVVLFGSQVSNHATVDSDYDILIVLKTMPDWKTEREISDLCYEAELKFGIITDVHILGKEELDRPRGKQPVFVNALSTGFHA